MLMETTIDLEEIYYASTQQSLLTGRDGFGIRTHTEGMEPSLIDRIKGLNLFGYSSGKKELPSVAALRAQPDLPNTYPPTIQLNLLQDGRKTKGVLSRVVYLGHDYLYYLTGQEARARSGNVFGHVFVWDWESGTAGQVVEALLTAFAPKDCTNVGTNLELVGLLVGVPQPLVKRQLRIDANRSIGSPSQLTTMQRRFLEPLMLAVLANSPLVARVEEQAVPSLLAAAFENMPTRLLDRLTFHSNHHDFGIPTRYSLVFFNEYHSSNSMEEGLEASFEVQQQGAPRLGASQFVGGYLQAVIAGRSLLEPFDEELQDFLKDGALKVDWDRFWVLLQYGSARAEVDLDMLKVIVAEFDWGAVTTAFKEIVLLQTFSLLVETTQRRDFEIASKVVGILLALIDKGVVRTEEVPMEIKETMANWLRTPAAVKHWPCSIENAEKATGLIAWEALRDAPMPVLNHLSSSSKLADWAIARLLTLYAPVQQVVLLQDALAQGLIKLPEARERLAQNSEAHKRDAMVKERYFPKISPEMRESLFGETMRALVRSSLEASELQRLFGGLSADGGAKDQLGQYFQEAITGEKIEPLQKILLVLAWEAHVGLLANGESQLVEALDQWVSDPGTPLDSIQLEAWRRQHPGRKAWQWRLNWLASSLAKARELSSIEHVLRLPLSETSDETVGKYLQFAMVQWGERGMVEARSALALYWAFEQAYPQREFAAAKQKVGAGGYCAYLLLKHLAPATERAPALWKILMGLAQAYSGQPKPKTGNRLKIHSEKEPYSSEEVRQLVWEVGAVSAVVDGSIYKETAMNLDKQKDFPNVLRQAFQGNMFDQVRRFFKRLW
jgi:hypothetical protein